MKKNIIIITILLVIVVVSIVYLVPKKEVIAPVVTDISYSDLNEKENVESYLRSNIATLSPVKAVLGGTWYVVSMTLDFEKNSGTVTYKDGHVQEKKNFIYTINEKREVVGMTIN